ncbi:MAG: hypothetical protein Q4E13_05710 [Clostridia bacterium]|nr:hypothetical protein [Clostridia bacterium]
MGLEAVHIIVDKGYESAGDIEKCLMNGIVPDVGFIQNRGKRVFSLDCEEREITPAIKDSAKFEDIQSCLHTGILPNCYGGTNINIQTQSLSQIRFLIRYEDDRVTCPIGRELFE